ncbi:hypothetical protein GWK53_09125 [Burkholderia cepacia]|uniref:hypothetical protein n=1 Tax=Burkholderia cepacia TaxID=292 RepID=UPI0013F43DB4|nr:hypothetical protein [Burkholderia cepacia]NHB06672.1 hypothetical protein [Burkholderia cepacia]
MMIFVGVDEQKAGGRAGGQRHGTTRPCCTGALPILDHAAVDPHPQVAVRQRHPVLHVEAQHQRGEEIPQLLRLAGLPEIDAPEAGTQVAALLHDRLDLPGHVRRRVVHLRTVVADDRQMDRAHRRRLARRLLDERDAARHRAEIDFRRISPDALANRQRRGTLYVLNVVGHGFLT